MPLPTALLDRLKKRGIIAEQQSQVEVYAEHKRSENSKNDDFELENQSENKKGAPGCPNKWNEFHKCVEFCFDHWREGASEDQLPEIYLLKRKECLRKYPLPDNWKEVYDQGIRRYYYWNFYTDEVSWFPPRHPRAVITISGPQASSIFYEELEKEQASKVAANSKNSKRRKRDDDREDRRRDPMTRDDSDEEVELSDRDKLRRAKRRGIDPMDPAAYGDNVPVGGWATGINREMAEAADDSVSGALFEKRPYPAPGAILRKNMNP
ncbi:hypothetical protein FO519_009287 [Halicephalobus sp. NKZ332]|nr:hypothetical protein FO519_009287 [Halicephalobus sp. NKZ332]